MTTGQATLRTFTFGMRAHILGLLAAALSGCMSPGAREPVIDPDAARAEIARLLPSGVSNRDAWAVDIFAAFEALEIAPTAENACAVIAVTQQESTFQPNPPVAGLAKIVRQEIDDRARRIGIPKLVVGAALKLRSPNGKTYSERIDKATTEKELSEVFEEFIDMAPLGSRLFADWNPIRTGGAMQVSIAFAEAHAKDQRYPYPVNDSIRREVFTRRGGMYFGIAHLLDYEANYDQMLFRFADFNAGHYASRNAGFQNALSIASKTKLALDGDLLRHDSSEPSNTELAARKLAAQIELSDADIHRDLELEKAAQFERTKVYKRVFSLAEKTGKRSLPKAVVPSIRLQSPKITRKLTTEWFARRVDERYKQCLKRSAAK
jgi:hypothetical protein